jgi:transposase
LPERWRVDRARIILACAEGMSNAAAAQALGVAVKSVSEWRRQFASPLAAIEQNSRNASSLSACPLLRDSPQVT